MDIWKKINGIIGGIFQLGFDGPFLKKGADDELEIKGSNGTSDTTLIVATGNVKALEVSDGVDKKTTITMPVGAAGDLELELPVTAGNAGEVLTTDGAGVLSWSSSREPNDVGTHKYDLVFGSSTPLNLRNYANNTLIDKIVVVVTTPFDGVGADVEIGVAADPDRFVASNEVNLKKAAAYVIDVAQLEATGAQMIATFDAGTGGTAGAAKIITFTSVPA